MNLPEQVLSRQRRKPNLSKLLNIKFSGYFQTNNYTRVGETDVVSQAIGSGIILILQSQFL